MAEGINDWAASLGQADGKGSNNWVVAGAHSASGKPLLANDPHLGPLGPGHLVLRAPAGAGGAGRRRRLDVIGATLPGLPFVVMGRTAKAAWGFTNTAPDVQDLYLEQINPANPRQYRVPSAGASNAEAWADFRQPPGNHPGQGPARFSAGRARKPPRPRAQRRAESRMAN
jgi:penicillin amidase